MKIAVIGLGISGLGAMYILNANGHQVTGFEKNDYIGGHSRTIEVEGVPVDTGFIVFNYRNYPHLTGLFRLIDVPVEKSDMSFAASINGSWLEYGTQSVSSVFAQKKNLFRPQFLMMLREIFKFNKRAKDYIASDYTLGEVLDKLNLGEWFRKYYILAIGGAIWSTPVDKMLEFPAKSFIRFFDNHGLLTVNDQPQWYTVTGGSREYVKRVAKGLNIRTNSAVKNVERRNGKILVDGEEFDHVIFGCHSDQALKIISDASNDEKYLLGNFKYQKNDIVVHSDESFMPKNKACWASWVYKLEGKDDKAQNISLSYWMNRLQNLATTKQIFVTLNPTRKPAADKIYNEHVFEHPVFDEAAIGSQPLLNQIQGAQNTWFCGAYQRYGFHEDGLSSAVEVCRKLGATIPWEAK
jgi:predicted NAD/FAD-binding protein